MPHNHDGTIKKIQVRELGHNRFVRVKGNLTIYKNTRVFIEPVMNILIFLRSIKIVS